MKELFKKEWLYRGARTFFQAFVSSALVLANTIDFTSDREILKGALISLFISSLSAGISALMNLQGGK